MDQIAVGSGTGKESHIAHDQQIQDKDTDQDQFPDMKKMIRIRIITQGIIKRDAELLGDDAIDHRHEENHDDRQYRYQDICSKISKMYAHNQ